ncbi:hypothetical protein CDV56_108500 [Neofusicoccum parvum]|nr:hypothetical protein CDV56_108500 [Neofusicoccum parvum]
MGPLLGKSIFTTDSQEWAHLRAILRPNFVKDQVAELEMLERYMEHLMALIPKDGSTIDLQELFFRFTLNLASEFLFGHSMNTLHQSGEADR